MKNNGLQVKIFNYMLDSASSEDNPVREADIARHFNVSLPPIREALSNLEEKRFVVRRRKKGTYLRSFSLKEINDMYDLRSVMEGLAARLLSGIANDAVIKELNEAVNEYEQQVPGRNSRILAGIDYKFHSLIVESCGNERLVEQIKESHVITKSFRKTGGKTNVPESPANNPYTHRRILEAIAKPDGAAAENLMKKHVEWAKEHVIKLMIAKGSESSSSI